MNHHVNKAPRPLLVFGYEIPNPRVYVFTQHAIIALAPITSLVLAGHTRGAALAFVLGCAFFHLRNVVVRREVVHGFHGFVEK